MGRNICPVTKSKISNSGFSNKWSVVPEGPSEREQMMPMMQHETVTMMAAALRVRRNSSWKNEVLTS